MTAIHGWDPSLDPTTAPYGVTMATEKQDWPCGKCDRVFKSEGALKIHLTRTHNGGRKSSKRGHKSTRRGKKNDSTGTQTQDHIENHASYIFGKVETIIEYYSNSNGIPVKALTDRVASLLRH